MCFVRHFRASFRLFGLALLCAMGTTGLSLGAGFEERFETGATSWKFAPSEQAFRVVRHERSTEQPHRGRGSELIQIEAGNPGQVLVGHEVRTAQVIDELLPTVWVRCDRVGVQLFARVQLPRSRDPRTGQARWLMIPGSTYVVAGGWQQLSVANLRRQVDAQARLLRLSDGPAVDPREAYLDRVFVNVCPGPGTTTVSIDDLELSGVAARAPAPSGDSPSAAPENSSPDAPIHLVAAEEPVDGVRVRLSGTILLVDDRPFFPRVVEHRGEPLRVLASLGFNVARLSDAPTAQQLEEARASGMWLICPPPRPAHLAEPQAGPTELAPFGTAFERVLAWDFGSGLDRGDLELVRRWTAAVRRADERLARPLLATPEADLRAYSRIVDLLVGRRYPLSSSMELNDFGAWIRERPRLARPGTPIWCAVQTQPAQSLLEQLSGLSAGRTGWSIESEQLRLLVHTALSAGARGLVFLSGSRLDADDPATQHRAMSLELVNLEAQLIDAWAASGSYVTTIASNVPDVQAAVMQTPRARLLMPIWSGRGAQFVPGQAAANGVSFVVPGVSESSNAFELTVGGLRTLQPKRVTGGTRITLEEFGLASVIVLSEDPVVVEHVRGRAAQIGQRGAALTRALAGLKLAAVAEANERLAQLGQRLPQSAARLTAARESLVRADQALASGDRGTALLESERSTRPLRMLAREHWQPIVATLPSPVSSPLAVMWSSLPLELAMARNLARAHASENLLPGGDFERLDRTIRAGWQHHQHPQPGVISAAEIATDAAHAGTASLRLRAAPVDPQAAPGVVESPPLWVTSAAVAAEAGQLFRLRGFVKVLVPVTGSVDGLTIFDSYGGQVLAERIGQTDGWREFVLYRIAPRSEPLVLTIALSGMGEALVDDVTIERVDPGPPATAARGPSRPAQGSHQVPGPPQAQLPGTTPTPGVALPARPGTPSGRVSLSASR